MKELKISQLMDDYTDNEFCIEGETWVDNEELKSLVLEQVKPKRKMKPLFKGLIAAAAAVGIVAVAGVVGASYESDLIRGSYISVLGTNIEYYRQAEPKKWQDWTVGIERELPVVMKSDRIFFNAGDGTSTDITDIIDDNTPYIVESVNPDGYFCYQIIGGTPEDYGFIEVYDDGEGWKADCIYAADDEGYKPWAAAAIERIDVEGEPEYCYIKSNFFVRRWTYESGWDTKYHPDTFKMPVMLTNDKRIVLTADGQNLDITDMIDGNTPYIYKFQDPLGYDCYIVVGGTPYDYGWAYLFTLEGFDWKWYADGGNVIWGFDRPWYEQYKEWYVEALDQLDIRSFPGGGYSSKADPFDFTPSR